MERIKTDILIIGAGPAGSAAALTAAQTGVDVLMVEQKNSIGIPIQCAEFIPAMLLQSLDIKNSFSIQKITGMKTYIRGILKKTTKAPGFMINRALFDKNLAKNAQQSGARLLTSTKAVVMEDDKSVVLKLKKSGKLLNITARVIIAADGPKSRVAKWINMPVKQLLPGVQVSFPLTRKSEFTHVFLEPEIYAGYGWLFPKENMANVGIGFKKNIKNPQSAGLILRKFADQLKKAGKIYGDPVEPRAGWIPVCPVQSAVHKNILLVGDAAGQTHPVTGAGIFSAVTCGKMAGRWAARSVLKDNVSLLIRYDQEWQEMFGKTLSQAYNKRVKMETRWQEFDRIIKSCWITFGEYYA